MSPLEVPQWGPFGESCLFPEPSFTCFSDSPIKSSPGTTSPFARSPWSRNVPSMFPKRGPNGKRRPFLELYLTVYPSGSPLKEPSLQTPLTGLLQREREREQETPFPEPSICLSKSLVNDPPPGFPPGPLWREMLVSRAFHYISFRVPSKELPLPGSSDRVPIERELLFQSPPSISQSLK